MQFIPRFVGSLALATSVGALALGSLTGCSMSADVGNGFGATAGGVQDIGLARTLVEDGIVPPASAFLVEGMLSDHDLPLGGPACERTLCVRGAGGLAPDATGEARGWVQVGLSSRIDVATFERPAQTLVFVVDVSGSMGWGSGANAPGELSRTLLQQIAEQLTPDDDVALVAYGTDVRVPVPLGALDATQLSGAIRSLREAGATNLEAGLERGLAIAREARAADAERPVRVMLFTDEQPNVGATTPEAFGGMASRAADENIGLTVFGAGRGLGQDIFVAMSHLRGGNAFSLFEQDDVAALMSDSWPWMVVPIATDLVVAPRLAEGIAVRRGHGFPAAAAGQPVELVARTVFLSRRRGALLIELGAEPARLAGAELALELSYVEPSGTPVEQRLEIVLPSEAGFSQPSVARATALTLLVEGMRAAAERYRSDRSGAVVVLQAARDRYAADLGAEAPEPLARELEFADALLALMRSGASQR